MKSILLTAFPLVAVVAVLLFASVPAAGQAAQPEATPRTPRITVTGSGSAKASPDVAYVSLGVTTTGKRAQDASQSNAAASDRVTSALKKMGIAEKDIQTANYYVQPVTDPRDGTKITGYQVSNIIRATVRKVENVGKAVDAGLEAGANNVQNVSFGLEKRDAAEAEALTAAVTEARRKAEVIAKAAGVRIVSIQEISTSYEGRPMPMMAGFGGEAAMARVATPISPGEMEVAANVTMVFQITAGGGAR
jgi:uncharacterized protein YggE